MQTVVSTDGVRLPDRFGHFRDGLLGGCAVPVEAYRDTGTDPGFSGRMEAGLIGAVTAIRMASLTTGHYGYRRDPQLIRRLDPDDYQLVLARRSLIRLAHNDRSAEQGPGDLLLVDAARPFDCRLPQDHASMLILSFPKDLLPLHRRSADALLGVKLSGRTGIGATLRAVMSQAVDDMGAYTAGDAARVSGVLLDLIAGLLAHELDGPESPPMLPDGSHRRVLYQQVQRFIEERLSDPSLTPRLIAEAHHISLRTLHRLFEAHDHTVADWIRCRRLDRCRRALADPALAGRPIHVIAATWGFSNAAHFTRAFRAAYGLNPYDYRRRVHGDGREPSG